MTASGSSFLRLGWDNRLASILQHHPTAKVLIDSPAATALQRADYYRWVYENKPAWEREAGMSPFRTALIS